MEKKDLIKKHDNYNEMIADWDLCAMAYKGGKPFIQYAIGDKNPLESRANYNARIKEGINFNYVEAIIDLFNFYLTEKAAIRSLPFLKNNAQWNMFLKDCDFRGTDFDLFINEAQKVASYQGAVGLLVDKPNIRTQTIEQEINKGIYPYISVFTLPNIFDFKYERDPETGRPKLVFLKLREDNDHYYIWYPGRWEKWKDDKTKQRPIKINTGFYNFNEIPFIWFQNLKQIVQPYFGKSDAIDISRIVASIIRNVSMGEEVIKFAGFPMMRVPMGTEDDGGNEETGPDAVKQFNPEFGESGKPDWMETAIKEPIEAILSWIDKKVDEIYRVVHLSGVHGQRKSNNNEVSSGLALRYEFQQLTSVLTKKSNNTSEAEREIIKFFCKWQSVDFKEEEIDIKRKKDFSVDDLSINLDNLIKSMKWVASKTFRVMSQQYIAKQALPDISEQNKNDIMKEIEQSDGELPENDKDITNQKVRNALKAAKGTITKPDQD